MANAASRSQPTSIADSLRLPPHSIEAEQAVLGGLMLDNSSWDQVADRLASEDFYRHDHRLIFSALRHLAEANQPLDVVTVSERLEANQQLEELNRIASTIDFNGQKLFDGTFIDKKIQVGAKKGQTLDISVGDLRTNMIGAVAETTSKLR